jgi:thioesterase domain-containing protein
LRRAPGVVDAAVAVQRADDSDARLIGYYVAANGQDIPPKTLSGHLSQNLPDYMVPVHWMRLDAMPQTANGKLNRKALPPVKFGRQLKIVSETAAPQLTAFEENVAQIWRDLLKTDDVSIDTHFFDAGGHSVLALQMVARLQAQLQRQVTIADLFRCPRLRDFANQLADAPGAAADAEEAKIVRIQEEGSRTPVIALNNAWNLWPFAKALVDRPLISIQFIDRTFNEPKSAPKFAEVVDEAVGLIRAAQPHGPYILLGPCILGAIALEAARRLKQEGEEVELVAMLGTEPARFFADAPLRDRLFNYGTMELRRIKDYVTLWRQDKVNLTFVIARFKLMHRLGLPRLAKMLGWRERWHDDDLHLQHIIDAYADQVTKPYDGPVAYYNNVAAGQQGAVRRWMSWVNNWKTLLPKMSSKDIVSTHLTMLQEPTVHIIAEHFMDLLDSVEGPQPKPADGSQAVTPRRA